MMKAAFAVLLLLCIVLPARADVRLQGVPWGPELPPGTTIAAGGVGGDTVLGVGGPTPPDGVQVLSLDTRTLTSNHIALRGTIGPNHTQGTVRVVMWAEYVDGKRFNSEAFFHPLGGTSELSALWNEFTLPMHSLGSTPVRLTLRVIMSGEGRITFGPMSLWDITPLAAPRPSNVWWNVGAGAWIGSIAGSLMGLIGALCGYLGSRTKYGLVFVVMLATMSVGIVVLVVGVVAACIKQPYEVYVPLLLIGFIATAVFTPLLFQCRRLQRQSELRKIRALDAS